MNFYQYFPYLSSDMKEFRYEKSEHGTLSVSKFRKKWLTEGPAFPTGPK